MIRCGNTTTYINVHCTLYITRIHKRLLQRKHLSTLPRLIQRTLSRKHPRTLPHTPQRLSSRTPMRDPLRCGIHTHPYYLLPLATLLPLDSASTRGMTWVCSWMYTWVYTWKGEWMYVGVYRKSLTHTHTYSHEHTHVIPHSMRDPYAPTLPTSSCHIASQDSASKLVPHLGAE